MAERSKLTGWTVGVLEYIFAGFAIANVIWIVYRLGHNAVVAFAPATDWLLPLWFYLAVVIHFLGIMVVWLRVKFIKYPKSTSLLGRIKNALLPCAFQDPVRMHLKMGRRSTLLFIALAWFTNIAVLAHVIFGMLVISSLLIFSVTDAVVILARFAVSAIVWRVIAHLELSGIAEQIQFSLEARAPEDSKRLLPQGGEMDLSNINVEEQEHGY